MLKFDNNNDGMIDYHDCPYVHGSTKAKLWWKQVEAHSKLSITDKMKARYGSKVEGAFNGKPLVPHEIGSGQGDYQFLVNKLVVDGGYSPEVAGKIAGSISQKMYPVPGTANRMIGGE